MGLELKLRSLTKLNLKFFLDTHFLREGSFINVASGALFYDGSDMSVLLPDTSAGNGFAGVGATEVWQSPFRQWVYESGVPLDGTNISAPAILASGLYIEGAFRGLGDPEFGHTIDYQNGRIIFNDPQSLDLKVHGYYSAREVRVDFEHAFNQQMNTGYLESKYMTNPLTSNNLVYPSGNAQPFPAVFIEIAGRSFEAYEIGNRSAIIKDDINLHVWALDDVQRDNIIDILTGQWRKTFGIIDFNLAPLPLSGVFNTLSPEYIPYQNLLKNNEIITTVGSGTPIRYSFYIDDVFTRNMGPAPQAEEYETAIVTFKTSVYLNAPTTPLGHIFGPITTLPTIQDTGF